MAALCKVELAVGYSFLAALALRPHRSERRNAIPGQVPVRDREVEVYPSPPWGW